MNILLLQAKHFFQQNQFTTMAVPMVIRNPCEDLHVLSTTRSFLHLQETAFLIKEKYNDPVDLHQIQKITFRPQEIDSVAVSILQGASVPDLKPVRTLADGNCLFNAASMALCGSSKLANELRLRTAIELVLNLDYYSKHPMVTNAKVSLKFNKKGSCSESRYYDAEAVFLAAIFSSEACTLINKHGFRCALEQEIKNTFRLGCFSGLLQIMGLSSAVGCQIKMVYPDKRHTMYPLLNGMYNPRIIVDKEAFERPRINIMWSCLQGWPDRTKEFNVNHFVLLTNISEDYQWCAVSRSKTKTSVKCTGPKNATLKPSTTTAVPRPNRHGNTNRHSQRKDYCSAKTTGTYNRAKQTKVDKDDSVATQRCKSVTQNAKEVYDDGVSHTQQKKLYGSAVASNAPWPKTPMYSQTTPRSLLTDSNCIAKKAYGVYGSSHTQPKRSISKPRQKKMYSSAVTINDNSPKTHMSPQTDSSCNVQHKIPSSSKATGPLKPKINKTEQDSIGTTKKPTIPNFNKKIYPPEKKKRTIQPSLWRYFTGHASGNVAGKDFKALKNQSSRETQANQGSQAVIHNISEVASLTARCPNSKAAKLKNISRISNDVPLSFTSHMFHNDKTFAQTRVSGTSNCAPKDISNTTEVNGTEQTRCFVHNSSTESNNSEVTNFNLPLAVSARWYTNQGELANANKKRTERRRTLDKTTGVTENGEMVAFYSIQSQTGSLQENIKSLEKSIKENKNEKQQRYLAAILEVAQYLNNKFPILKTQDASKILKNATERQSNVNINADCSKMTRTTSSEIYDKLARHLNVVHVHIKGTGFIMENKKESALIPFLDSINSVFDQHNAKAKLKRHIESEIGDVYRSALDYMDSERDRNALKFILTKITSINFMTRLQNIKNKKSLQTCRDLVPKQLRQFENLRQELRGELEGRDLSPRQEQQLIRRKLQIEKRRQIRARRNINTGAKLKIEEFPDLVAILEYEFGEGDNKERGGGGLESHAKLHNDLLYRAADNKTKMKDAREAILALAPEDFSISLSACFNYTQNYRKGTYQARRHHEGMGINACVSLHKAPDTAPIKDVVINVHWSSANVNFILDEASKNPDLYCVDSRDAKQVIRPNIGFGGKTWKNIRNPDHTFDTSRTNAVTPMTHLLVETTETARTVRLNTDDNVQELFMTTAPRKEVMIHLKRSGKAVTLLNLSYYEPETIFRSINELLYLMTLPSLDSFFRNPSNGMLKDVFVFIVDNGVEMPRSPIVKMLLVRLRRLLGIERVLQVAFAEYHSKRNPVERVHAEHTKQLEKHGPFHFNTALQPNTKEHVDDLNNLRDGIREELNQASFGGARTLVINGIGDENNFVFNDSKNLDEFLRMNEESKQKCETQYFPNVNSKIFQELVDCWGIDEDFTGIYSDDYNALCENYGGKNKTAWTDKYTTVIFNENSLAENIWEQPLPDYIRWYMTGGEYHYMTFEQRRELQRGPWDNIKELFLPSRLLDMAYLSEPFISDSYIKEFSRLCWCPENEIRRYLQNKETEAETDYAETMHRAKWQQHKLYNNSKESLENMCRENNLNSNGTKNRLVENLVDKLGLERPLELQKYLGNLADVPSNIAEIKKLPVYKLKQFLRFHNIQWTGSKDQLALRVLALRTGTTNLLFRRERQGLLDAIQIAKKLIFSQITLNVTAHEFVTRKRAFSTPEDAELGLDRPREAAGNPRQQKTKNDIGSVSLDSLPDIFRELEILIHASESASSKRHDPDNREAIKTYGTRIVVKWTGEDNMNSWQPGWYTAKVLSYHQDTDEIKIEYLSEPGTIYNMNVDSGIKEGVLRVAGCAKVVPELYDTFTEIGANVLIKWDKNEVAASGWKPAWYAAKIQAFYPEEDKIDVIYRTTPKTVYSEDVTELIISGKIKLSK